MDWQCNIDRRGRLLRGVLGFITLAAGVSLLIWTDHDFWGTGAVAVGVFALFEAIRGWCAIRAMGIRTPL